MTKLIAVFLSFVTMIASSINMDLGAGVKVFNDISYGSEENQTVDFALPSGAKGDIGLLLMLHGGSWVSGDKSAFDDYLSEGASRYGIACASMNYRYLGDASMFEMLDDIGACLKKIGSTAKKKGVILSRVMLLGYSAGAHLALLYSYTRADKSPIRIVAAASFSGPTDFTDESFVKKKISKYSEYISENDVASLAVGYEVTGETLEKAVKSISPAFCVNSNSVPTLIVHGKKDKTVPYSNALTLAQKLENAGVPHALITLANSGHNLSNEKDAASAELADKAARLMIAKFLASA